MKDFSNTDVTVLSNLKKGERAVITGFNTEDIPSKFYSIGIVPGSFIEVYRIIPFKGPVCIIIGNNEGKLAIRRTEAQLIIVELKK